MGIGLEDHSEELSERCEKDARLQFYRDMSRMSSDYQQGLDDLARAVAEAVFDACVVHLVNDKGTHIELQAAYHPNSGVLQRIEQMYADHPQRVDEGVFGRVLETGEPYFQPYWSRMRQRHDTKPEYRETARKLNIHSLIVVPMSSTDNDIIGTLTVGRHNTSAVFDETDLAFMEWIAAHAAMKVEYTRLYHQLRRTNSELNRALKARDTFVAAATHELRTPLTVARLQAQHLLRRQRAKLGDGASSPSVEPAMKRMDIHLERLSQLVDRMLDVSRLCEGGLRLRYCRFDLCEVVEETVDSVRDLLDQAGCHVKLEMNAPQQGRWDKARVEQIVTNLLTNAAKYAPSSPVAIRVKERDEATVVIEVSDQGPGIPERAQRRIFERFERVVRDHRTSGLGLGLWLVRRYTEAMGGLIGVKSTSGQGATFTVALPRHPDD